MTAKLQDGYKNNAMHVNPKHKWCMKKKIVVKNIEIENFSVAIDQESIEHQSSQANSNQKFWSQFRLVEKQVRSIESLEKSNFWKTEHFNAETPQSALFYKKCMSMRRKVFQKHLNSTKIFQNQDFQSICSQSANIKHIMH